MKKQNTQIITVIGFVLIILLLLLYNHKRSMGYNFNITNKYISYNLIPFKNLKYIIINYLGRIITKLLFFSIIGAIFYLVKYLNKNNNFKITIFIILIILFIEVIHIFTGHSTVIDINNWIVYACGILIGYNLTNIIFPIFIKKIKSYLKMV